MIGEIAQLIGPAATARLIAAFGGREVRMPMRHSGRTWQALVDAVGERAAATLCEYYHGAVIYIASSTRAHTEHNRRRAAQMRSQGKSWSEIARALTRPQGYTERGARKLLEKRQSACAATLPLFDAADAAEAVPIE
jgi:hypothetical protein